MKNLILRILGLHIHRWDNWETVKQGQLLDGEEVVGVYFIQERRCVDCGKKQYSKNDIN